MNNVRDDKTYDVFISYSAVDREFTRRLASDLKDAGFRVWIDVWSLDIGDSFAEAINRAVRAARFMLIVMSPAYFQSQWTQQEWQYALASELQKKEVRLIPLLYRDCDIPEALRGKQWADFRDSSQYPVVLTELIHGLRRLTSRHETATPTAGVSIPGARTAELDVTVAADLKKTVEKAAKVFDAESKTAAPTKRALEKSVDETLCFIVMPFTVEPLNAIYEEIVRPVLVEKCGLRVERGDDQFGSRPIMDDITESITRARLIIADLTGRNANVFYEVGIAHAFDKAVLLMTQSMDDVPFDLRHRRALVYENSIRGGKKLEKALFENVQRILVEE